jgi:hypothetical protein
MQATNVAVKLRHPHRPPRRHEISRQDLTRDPVRQSFTARGIGAPHALDLGTKTTLTSGVGKDQAIGRTAQRSSRLNDMTVSPRLRQGPWRAIGVDGLDSVVVESVSLWELARAASLFLSGHAWTM